MNTDSNTSVPYFSDQIRFIPDAFALVYDLEGFSRFANQPDAARYVPRLLNVITSIFTDAIAGGNFWWDARTRGWSPIPGLLQRKFLGDGELILFENEKGLQGDAVTNFLNRFFNVAVSYNEIRDRLEECAPLAILPTGIRIGLARGSLYELPWQKGEAREYVGVCINLASRLQNYCPGIPFIASARSEMNKEHLAKHGWERIYAINVKGFSAEAVLVTEGALAGLDQPTRDALFSVTRPT